MDGGPNKQRIGNLSVKPLRFVQRQPSDLRSYPSQHDLAHWQRDYCPIHGKIKACTSGHPYGECEGIESSQFGILRLIPPVTGLVT